MPYKTKMRPKREHCRAASSWLPFWPETAILIFVLADTYFRLLLWASQLLRRHCALIFSSSSFKHSLHRRSFKILAWRLSGASAETHLVKTSLASLALLQFFLTTSASWTQSHLSSIKLRSRKSPSYTYPRFVGFILVARPIKES